MRLAIAAIAACFAVPATAQTSCAPHNTMMEQLADQYGEGRMSVALDNNGYLIEVYANTESGTWTAVLTTPDGEACIAAHGTAYEAIPQGNPT